MIWPMAFGAEPGMEEWLVFLAAEQGR